MLCAESAGTIQMRMPAKLMMLDGEDEKDRARAGGAEAHDLGNRRLQQVGEHRRHGERHEDRLKKTEHMRDQPDDPDGDGADGHHGDAR